ncbi:MAG TPA: hypothetical protein VJ866_20475 [Pyrinomonadaceae bacterium]|nr:hypothetical protein [Pyrinomonadaceae bacterium]
MESILIDPDSVHDELIDPDTANKMNMPFDVPGIRAEMERMLSIPKCRDFVKRLLAEVSSKAAPFNKLVAGGDVLKVFDMIMAQEMDLPKLVRACDFDNGADKTLNLNLAIGSLSGKNARIQIGSCRPGTAVTREELKAAYLKSDARMCLHETIHHCGDHVYTDEEFARAVLLMNVSSDKFPVPNTPKEDMRTRYSQYWDAVLKKSYK